MGAASPLGFTVSSRQLPTPNRVCRANSQIVLCLGRRDLTLRKWVGSLCILIGLVLFASEAKATERYAIIISGASGGEKYAAQQQQWRADLAATLKSTFNFPESNVVVLAEGNDGMSAATAENVRRLFADLRRRVAKDDTLLLVLIGHGTFDGVDAKFNLVGPDLTAREWKALLAGFSGQLVIVNTTEASFPFLEELSQRGRVVITATDSAAQRFSTVFPGYFVKAFSDPSVDFDKNGRVSIWEAFFAASTAVRRYYEERGQLTTERPLLDDDGDRVGREAESPGQDGQLARAIYLDAGAPRPTGDVELASLERQRREIEAQIEALKLRKPLLGDDEYAVALEKLLVELARVSQQIRNRS